MADVAETGGQGLEMAQGGGYDLVILDVMLPDLGGFDVLKQIREAGLDVPVLCLTAQGEVSARIRGLNLGADDYLSKPFEPENLRATVRRVLHGAGK